MLIKPKYHEFLAATNIANSCKTKGGFRTIACLGNYEDLIFSSSSLANKQLG
jgi:hypothetical protein